MAYRIVYKSSTYHDLKQLDRGVADRVLREVHEVLSKDPGAGEALKGEFKGLYKLRVGEYRVIYARAGDTVLILRIRHRGRAYS